MKLLLAFLCAFASLTVFAQSISVQGVLRDPKGRTVEDGSYAVTFRLYDQQTGGTALFVETHPSITTSQGLFATRLGSINSLYQLTFDTAYYLGTSVEQTDELEPRTPLTLSPYTASSVGKDNQFPSTGDVTVKENFLIDLGDVFLKEGNVMLSKGAFDLDSGNITINLGDIYFSGASSALRFPDGTILNSANGGTASSATSEGTVGVLADADLDSAGAIEFQIGVTPAMRITNSGTVEIANGIQFDSSKLMYIGERDIQFGHYTPSDSTFIAAVSIGYDSIAQFLNVPQSLDSAIEDNELVTLKQMRQTRDSKVIGTTTVNGEIVYDLSDPNAFVNGAFLNSRKASTQHSDQYELGQVIGESNEQGTIFYLDDNYVYITKLVDEPYKLAENINNSGLSWDGSDAFGSGYSNTLSYLNAMEENEEEEYWAYQLKNNHPAWYLPSVNEMNTLSLNLPDLYSLDYYWTSSLEDCGGVWVYGLQFYNNNKKCQNASTASKAFLVRRIERDPKTVSGENSTFATYEILQDKFARLQLTLDQVKESWVFDLVEETYRIGEQAGGGTVFTVEDGFAYIAFYLEGEVHLSKQYNGWTDDTGFGSGEQNTESLFRAYTDYGSSYTVGRIQSPINGYDYWWIPSEDEFKSILSNTDLGYSSSSYYWTSSQSSCSNSQALVIDWNGRTACRHTDSYYFPTIIIRKIPSN